VELVVDAGVLEVEEGTDATPRVDSPPVTTAGGTATGAVDGTAAAGTAGPNVGFAATGAAAGTTADGFGRRTVGAATMPGAPSDAKSGEARRGAARPVTGGSDGEKIGDGVSPDRAAEVVGVDTGSTAKLGAARRDLFCALGRSPGPTAATPPDVSASAVLRGWPPPSSPSVTAVTHIAVASAALPTARRRRRPRGT
jgi:hypothetical protein